ncbi:SGNH/GDSL hydrolase family protein [Microbacterium sp. ET2]|uniref:SGNH/GDSL hydrolase family protein n=1 Tax=Microbacterium albipurpureum TaxID=3050384 RepID=UPI00259C6C9B|nr:SGNH/GDSL hydrolase family protein [Microbacterium sp. ET2 (Ac-2212)]WJL96009.1 SGNH/GDSL hydrolase family protein [Microbacterium sp. ET2 (Ac-2212)]
MRSSATAARIGGVALAVAVVLTVAVTVELPRTIRRQAGIARRRIGKPLGEDAWDTDRVWRRRLHGDPIDLVVLGDSIAAGLGAQRPKQTLGARVAKGLGTALLRPVRLRSVAVVGSESSALPSQIARLPSDLRPDLAVIIVGGNDVTHRVPMEISLGHLADAVRELRARGARVVVGTCPDLGALRPVPQPLRALASRLSRRLAAGQARVARALDARPVSLRAAVGHAFARDPEAMFSADRFHPSALGYRRTAEALVPALVAEWRARS